MCKFLQVEEKIIVPCLETLYVTGKSKKNMTGQKNRPPTGGARGLQVRLGINDYSVGLMAPWPFWLIRARGLKRLQIFQTGEVHEMDSPVPCTPLGSLHVKGGFGGRRRR
jgi:hypothetical protein